MLRIRTQARAPNAAVIILWNDSQQVNTAPGRAH